MKNRKKIMSTLTTVCAVLGIVAAHPFHASAVIGGTVPSTDSVANAVVKIGPGALICSGVMISPSWVLTARHCVDDINILGDIDTVTPIKPGIHRNEGNYMGEVYRAPSGDLALININGVHKGTIAQLPTQEYPLGSAAQSVGFGGSGVNIRTAESVNMVLSDIYSKKSGKFHHGVGRSHYLLFDYDSAETGRIYKGDSGGPIFIGDEVVGIMSHGDFNDSDGSFNDESGADVFASLEWILDTTGITVTDTAENSDDADPEKGPASNTSLVLTDNGPSHIGSNTSSALIGLSSEALFSS